MEVYDLAMVGCGLSALSFLRADRSLDRTVAVEYGNAIGGALRLALPARGFEAAQRLICDGPPPRVQIRTRTTALGLLPGNPHIVLVRTAQGTEQIAARRVLIASGGLEATRESAQIPGSRPAGVVTPILVHQLLDLGYLPGRHAVVYGTGGYAAATARRMADAGMKVTQLETGDELVEISGFPRLERVGVLRHGLRNDLPTDTLVYAGGMRANTLWLKGSGIGLEPNGTIAVDERFETSIPRVFAMGTVVAPSLDHAASIAMGESVAQALQDLPA